MAQKIIVIGLSAASMSFITKLKTFDSESEVLCFSAEVDMPYNRCLLADWLVGDVGDADIALKPAEFFEKNKVKVMLNTKVTALDTQRKEVFVGKQSYQYDYLFLGIGTGPFVPSSLATQDIAGVYTFHTLADMRKIHDYIASNIVRSAIVIGAGLNGMEAASSLHSKGIAVTIVEAQHSVLPGQVTQDIASWVNNHIQRRGVTALTGRKVVRIDQRSGKVTGVCLDTGSFVNADIVVIAAGSKLNNELVSNASFELYNGSLVVSSSMQTSSPYIFAAGDICAVPDLITKKLMRSTTWSDAMLQGLCAATSLSATPRPYPGAIGLRDSYFFGLDFYACGDTISSHCTQKVVTMTDGSVEVWYTGQDTLQGFVLLGDISKVAELKKLYVTQQSV